MNPLLAELSSQHGRPPTQAQDVETAIVIYDDVLSSDSGRHAARQFKVDGRRRPTVSAWNACFLDEPYFQKVISDHLSQADMILVALQSASELTQSLRRWIHRWAADMQGQRTLVVMVRESDPEVIVLSGFLKSLASRYTLELFTHKDDHEAASRGVRCTSFWLL